MVRCLTVLLAFALVGSAFGQLRLLKTDGTAVDVETHRVDPEAGVTLDDDSVLSWDEIVRLTRPAPPRVPRSGQFDLYLRGGGKLTGTPAGIVDETLRFTDPNVGEVALDLGALAGIVPTGEPTPRSADQTDVLLLANGDELRGVVLDVTADVVTIQTTDGQTVEVDTTTLARLRFAALGPVPDVGRFLVRLGAGLAYPVDGIELGGGRALLQVR
ncbi:MAG: hypothetical protein AAF743_00205, partial [Planctomycetota bacterium]